MPSNHLRYVCHPSLGVKTQRLKIGSTPINSARFGEFSVHHTTHTVTDTRLTVQVGGAAAVRHADDAGWRAQPPVHPGCVPRSFSGCQHELVLDSAA
jgi:hypothetical protein